MGIQDKWLSDMAKSMNNESFDIPAYLTVATTVVTSIDTTATALSGEVGTRVALTGSRLNTVNTYSGIRTGALVIDTINGDILNQSGLNVTLSGNDLQVATIHSGVTQTTNFDLDFQYTVEWKRS